MKKTTFSLFIIESLRFEDEAEQRFEGRILRDIFQLSGHDVEYLYIRTRRELQEALRRFHASRKRYLHISCHGSNAFLQLTLDKVPFRCFAEDASVYLKGRRLFVSACAVVSKQFASVLPQMECLSLIGPRANIAFDDAVIIWATFYHLMFRHDQKKMMKREIRSALTSVCQLLPVEFGFYRLTKSAKGYSIVHIGDRRA
jgi:hypothetical protein